MTDHGWGINSRARSPSRAQVAATQPGAARAGRPRPPCRAAPQLGRVGVCPDPQNRAGGGGVGGAEHLAPGLRMASDAKVPAHSRPQSPPLGAESAVRGALYAVKCSLRTPGSQVSGITGSSILEASGLHSYSLGKQSFPPSTVPRRLLPGCAYRSGRCLPGAGQMPL